MKEGSKEVRKEGNEKGRSGASKQPPIMPGCGACQRRSALFCVWIIFVCFARPSYVGARRHFCMLLIASVTKVPMHTKCILGKKPHEFAHSESDLAFGHGIALWYRWVAPWISGWELHFFTLRGNFVICTIHQFKQVPSQLFTCTNRRCILLFCSLFFFCVPIVSFMYQPLAVFLFV